MEELYYYRFAFAALRESLKRSGKAYLVNKDILEKDIDTVTDDEIMQLIEYARANGIKTYNFKKSNRELPRVHKVMGFLKGICFDDLLDVGSGRGVFLFPFMEEFPYIPVTSIDILDKRVDLLNDISHGGIERLTVCKASLCDQPFEDNSFDVITLLEVLEHIPDVEAAVRSAINMARKYIVVTVPSKEDSNPEHIHLLTKEKLIKMFDCEKVTKLSFDGVPGHLFMIAKLGKEE